MARSSIENLNDDDMEWVFNYERNKDWKRNKFRKQKTAVKKRKSKGVK